MDDLVDLRFSFQYKKIAKLFKHQQGHRGLKRALLLETLHFHGDHYSRDVAQAVGDSKFRFQ
jgi:hypothetical protein